MQLRLRLPLLIIHVIVNVVHLLRVVVPLAVALIGHQIVP